MLGMPVVKTSCIGQSFGIQCFFSISAVPHANVLSIPFLLAKEKTDHFEVNTNNPVVFVIPDEVYDLFNIIILFFSNQQNGQWVLFHYNFHCVAKHT